jgi:hypothetical protein
MLHWLRSIKVHCELADDEAAEVLCLHSFYSLCDATWIFMRDKKSCLFRTPSVLPRPGSVGFCGNPGDVPDPCKIAPFLYSS